MSDRDVLQCRELEAKRSRIKRSCVILWMLKLPGITVGFGLWGSVSQVPESAVNEE